MSVSRTIASRYGLGLIVIASVTALSMMDARAEDGPFSGLEGAWVGNGTVTMADGTQERIRCLANYSVPPLGKSLNQGLKCASDSYRFDVKSNVFVEAGGALRGTWSEATNQVTGSVSGHIAPGVIQTSVSSPAFSAHLSVTTQGGKQSVSIQPVNTTVKTVTIDMRRS